eukprot:CFRG0253T1
MNTEYEAKLTDSDLQRLKDHISACLSFAGQAEGSDVTSVYLKDVCRFLSEKKLNIRNLVCLSGEQPTSRQSSQSDVHTFYIGIITNTPRTAIIEKKVGDLYLEDCTGVLPIDLNTYNPVLLDALVLVYDVTRIVTLDLAARLTSPVPGFRPFSCCGSSTSVWAHESTKITKAPFTYMEVSGLYCIRTRPGSLDYRSVSIADSFKPVAVLDARQADTRVLLNVAGVVSAISPVMRVQNDVFFFAELRSFEICQSGVRAKCARCPTIVILFKGEHLVHWHLFFTVGELCVVTQLRKKTFKKSPILEAKPSPLSQMADGTVVLSACVFPALKNLEPHTSHSHHDSECRLGECKGIHDVPTVSYSGKITSREGMPFGIYALDGKDKLYLFLTHQESTSYGRSLRVGARIRITNAHPLFDTTPDGQRALIGLVCCTYSSVRVQEFSPIPEAPFVPYRPQLGPFSKFKAICSVQDYLWVFRAAVSFALKFPILTSVDSRAFGHLRLPQWTGGKDDVANVVDSNDIRVVIGWFMHLPNKTQQTMLGLSNKLLSVLSTDRSKDITNTYFHDHTNTNLGQPHQLLNRRDIYKEFLEHNTRGKCTVMLPSSLAKPCLRFVREVYNTSSSTEFLRTRILDRYVSNICATTTHPSTNAFSSKGTTTGAQYRFIPSADLFKTNDVDGDRVDMRASENGCQNNVLVGYLRYSTSSACLKFSDREKDSIDILVPGLVPEGLRCLFALRRFTLVLEAYPTKQYGVREFVKYIYANKKDILQLTQNKRPKSKVSNPAATEVTITKCIGKPPRLDNDIRSVIDADVLILHAHQSNTIFGTRESYATAVRIGSAWRKDVHIQISLLGKGEHYFPFLARGKCYRIINARLNTILSMEEAWVIDEGTSVVSLQDPLVGVEPAVASLDKLYDVRQLLDDSMQLADLVTVRGVVRERLFIAGEDPNDPSETMQIKLGDISQPHVVMDVYIRLQPSLQQLLKGLLPGSVVVICRVHARVSRIGNLYVHFKALSTLIVESIATSGVGSSVYMDVDVSENIGNGDVMVYTLNATSNKPELIIKRPANGNEEGESVSGSAGKDDLKYDDWVLRDFIPLGNPRVHRVWCFIRSIQKLYLSHECTQCRQVMKTTCLACSENFPDRGTGMGYFKCMIRLDIEDGTAEANATLSDTYEVLNHILCLNVDQQNKLLRITRERGNITLWAADLDPREANKLFSKPWTFSNGIENMGNHIGHSSLNNSNEVLGDLSHVYRPIMLLCSKKTFNNRGMSGGDGYLKRHLGMYSAEDGPTLAGSDSLLCEMDIDEDTNTDKPTIDNQSRIDLRKVRISKDLTITTRKPSRIQLKIAGVQRTRAADELRRRMR